MREIKFRAWDKEKKEMIASEYYNLVSFEGDAYQFGMGKLLKTPELKLMQYTGLKDENGVEIYEGDIIVGNAVDENGDKSDLLEVRFLQENSRFCLVGRSSWDDLTIFYFGDESDPKYSEVANSELEVIGNIYENPELLTK